MEQIERTGSVQNLPVRDFEKRLLRTAPEIKPEFHVRMQAVVQKNVDNAVSKTFNHPEHATREEIPGIFFHVRTLGCKGITAYQFNSREDLVLSRGCDTCQVDGLGS